MRRSRRQLPRQASSDLLLIARIARGDQLAMRTLFARHQVPVYRFILRFVRDEAMAEDVLSEVFLDVWRQAGRFESRSSVSTWLLAIARYKALSARRRRVDAELDDKTAERVVDTADTPEAALMKKDNGDVLRRCLSQLSPEQSEIIDLAYYHEKSVIRGRRDRRHPGSDRQDAHVLRAPEACATRAGRIAIVRDTAALVQRISESGAQRTCSLAAPQSATHRRRKIRCFR